MIILKWILKKLVFFLDLIIHYNTGQSEIFGKGNEIILQKKLNNFKYFAIETFWERIKSNDFPSLISSKIF